MHQPRFHRIYDYDRRLLPNDRLRALEDGVTTLEQAKERTGATIGWPGWGAIYFATLCSLAPGRRATIIETGSNWGCSTLVLASALRDAKVDGVVHTIELNAANAARARENFAASDVENRIVLHEGDSLQVLPRLLADVEDVTVAFLDGDHTYNFIRTEFEAVAAKLAPGGIILMDNTFQIAEPHEDQRVNGFLKDLVAERRGQLINLPFCSWYTPGLAIWQAAPF